MLIPTIYGELEERELKRRVHVREDDTKRERVIEYYLGPVLVHRSVHVILKGVAS